MLNAAMEYYIERSESSADVPTPIGQNVRPKVKANNTMIGKLINLERQQFISKRKQEKQPKKLKKPKVNTMAQLYVETANAVKKNAANPYANSQYSWRSSVSPIFKSIKAQIQPGEEEGDTQYFGSYILNPYQILEEGTKAIAGTKRESIAKAKTNTNMTATLKQKVRPETAQHQQNYFSNLNMKERTRSFDRSATNNLHHLEQLPRNFRGTAGLRKGRKSQQARPIQYTNTSDRSSSSSTDLSPRESESEPISLKTKIKLANRHGVGRLRKRESGGEAKEADPTNKTYIFDMKRGWQSEKNEFTILKDRKEEFIPHFDTKKASPGKILKQSVNTFRKKKHEPIVLNVNPNKRKSNKSVHSSASKASRIKRESLNGSGKYNFSKKKCGSPIRKVRTKRSKHSASPKRSFIKLLKGDEAHLAIDESIKLRKNPWFVPRNSPMNVSAERVKKLRVKKKEPSSEAIKEKRDLNCPAKKTARQKWLEILESDLQFQEKQRNETECNEADQERTSRSSRSSSETNISKRYEKGFQHSQGSESVGDTLSSKISAYDLSDEETSVSKNEHNLRMTDELGKSSVQRTKTTASWTNVRSAKSTEITKSVQHLQWHSEGNNNPAMPSRKGLRKVQSTMDLTENKKTDSKRKSPITARVCKSTNVQLAKIHDEITQLKKTVRKVQSGGFKDADDNSMKQRLEEENISECCLYGDQQSLNISITSSSLYSETSEENSKSNLQKYFKELQRENYGEENCPGTPTKQSKTHSSLTWLESESDESSSFFSPKESTEKLTYDEKYAQAMASIIKLKGLPLKSIGTKCEAQDTATSDIYETGDDNAAYTPADTALSQAEPDAISQRNADVRPPCCCSNCILANEMIEVPENYASSMPEAVVHFNPDTRSQIDKHPTSTSKVDRFTESCDHQDGAHFASLASGQSSEERGQLSCFSENYPSLNDFLLISGTPNLSESGDSFICLIPADATPNQIERCQCCSCQNSRPGGLIDSGENDANQSQQDKLLQQSEEEKYMHNSSNSSITIGSDNEQPRKLLQDEPYDPSPSNNDTMQQATELFEMENKNQAGERSLKRVVNAAQSFQPSESEMELRSFECTALKDPQSFSSQNLKPSSLTVWYTPQGTSMEHFPTAFPFEVPSSGTFGLSSTSSDPTPQDHYKSLMSEQQCPASSKEQEEKESSLRKSDCHGCVSITNCQNCRSSDTAMFFSCEPSEGEEQLDKSDYYLSVQEELASLTSKNKPQQNQIHFLSFDEEDFYPIQPDIVVEHHKKHAAEQISPVQIAAVLGSKATHGISNKSTNDLAEMLNSFMQVSHTKEKKMAEGTEEEYLSFDDSPSTSKHIAFKMPPSPAPHAHCKHPNRTVKRCVTFKEPELESDATCDSEGTEMSLKLKVDSLQCFLVHLVTKHPELKSKVLIQMAEHYPNLLTEQLIAQLVN